MKPRTYELLHQCIEDGISLGWGRAHKHTDTPDKELICEEIYAAISLTINEWFTFDELEPHP